MEPPSTSRESACDRMGRAFGAPYVPCRYGEGSRRQRCAGHPHCECAQLAAPGCWRGTARGRAFHPSLEGRLRPDSGVQRPRRPPVTRTTSLRTSRSLPTGCGFDAGRPPQNLPSRSNMTTSRSSTPHSSARPQCCWLERWSDTSTPPADRPLCARLSSRSMLAIGPAAPTRPARRHTSSTPSTDSRTTTSSPALGDRILGVRMAIPPLSARALVKLPAPAREAHHRH